MPPNMREQSEIVTWYIEAAVERDSAILKEIDWLERAQVRTIKMNTSLATMRLTVWWVSCGRQPNDVVKEHCEKWLKLRYKVGECVFMQSQDEVRAYTPLSTYFHCICDLRFPDKSQSGK